MKSLHIRNVDDIVLERLKALAHVHHRSLQGEVRAILEDASRLAREYEMPEDLDLVTILGNKNDTFSRESIYDDDAR